MSAEIAANAVRAKLAKQFPHITVDTDYTHARPLVVMEWVDAPRTSVARALAMEAVDHLKSVDRRDHWKLAFRGRLSRGMRLRARAAILLSCPDFDYVTETGDLNPDSRYRYDAPTNVWVSNAGGDLIQITGPDGSTNRLVTLVGYELMRQDGIPGM